LVVLGYHQSTAKPESTAEMGRVLRARAMSCARRGWRGPGGPLRRTSPTRPNSAEYPASADDPGDYSSPDVP